VTFDIGPGRKRAGKKRLDRRAHVQYHVHMNAITYTEVRKRLSETIERVCEDRAPIIVTKRRDKAVVIMSLDDYESLVETSYLLKSSRNARRLLESIKELEEGKGKERKLCE
jgi:antitoxin YefM